MKKLLIILTAILVVGGFTLNILLSDTKTFTDDTFNVSFEYPSDWEVLDDPNTSNNHAINLISNNGQENIYFDYKYNYNITQKEIEERFKISIEEFQNDGKDTTVGSFPAKQIGMHSSVQNLIKIDNEYVLVNSEFDLTEEQIKGLQIILDSISF